MYIVVKSAVQISYGPILNGLRTIWSITVQLVCLMTGLITDHGSSKYKPTPTVYKWTGLSYELVIFLKFKNFYFK